MPTGTSACKSAWRGGLRALGFTAVLCTGLVRAQTAAPVAASYPNGWQSYDWLGTSDQQQRQAASGDSVSVKSTQNLDDPFAVISSGSIWQEQTSSTYTHQVADSLSYSYQTSKTMLNGQTVTPVLNQGSPYDLSRGQAVSAQFQPIDTLTLNGNLHTSTTDAALPGDAQITKGAALSAQSHVPVSNGVLTLGMNLDQTGADLSSPVMTTTTAYDAQYQQPLGKLPLTAVLKGHLAQTTTTGAAPSSLPSLEQSLVWKPVTNATVQMGLRQQQYQEYPGIANQFNEALFADWSQKMAADITWHSYAELLNTRGMIDQAPASPVASGANGTPQATVPGSNASSLTSTLPVSLDDQTVTFSTGPSFQIQKDISASVEYSNRWDTNPTTGSGGSEQRVSLSVKGSF